MHLSRLTAFGFKSFAQKMDLTFGKGISCVVGPNGCGKSNVVDALRWALGEQRVRSLRSHYMEDVIFSGSRTRKALGMAEVSVTIDNSENLLPVDFSEVTVTRRLFRSGESDYLLNKIPCRLKDIQDLFMDTGLGASHAYIIEQGMVDEIISDKTEERRRVFEEAAGVTRYKVRRRSAWNKLQSLQQDLQRISDVIAEVERQVALLARQERKARLFKQLTDQLREMEVQLARYRYFEMSDRARPMLEEMTFLKEDVEVGSTDIVRLEARLEEVRAELTAQDQAVATANAEVGRQVEAAHRKDREIVVAREEARGIEGLLTRAARQQEVLKERQEVARQGQEAARQGEQEGSEALKRAEAALLEETGTREALLADLEARRGGADEQKARLIGMHQEISEVRGRLERARAEVEGLSHRQARLGEDVARVRARRQEAEGAADAAAGQIADLEQALEERTSLRRVHTEARDRLQAERDGLVEERNSLRTRMEADGARLALLEKLREGFEGYSRGVRTLAVDSPFSDRIKGVVADLIDVDPMYTSAIEATMGRALECLLVDTTADAAEAMAYLRSSAHGAAAFLPTERVAQGNGMPWTPPVGEGIVGRASDLLRGPANGAARSLLCRTLVVADVEAALPLMAQMQAIGVDIATLDGEVLAADGTVYGGVAVGEETGLIGRAGQVEMLWADLEAGRAGLEAFGADICRVGEATAKAAAQVEADDGALADLRNRLVGLQRDQQNASAEAKRQGAADEELHGEAAWLKEREAELRCTVAEGEAGLEALEARRSRLEEEVRQADEALREQERKRRAQQDAVSAQQVEIATLGERVENLHQEAARLAQAQTDLGREMERLALECAENEARKADLGEVVQSASTELEALHKVQTELERKRDTQVERQQELMVGARELEEKDREVGRRVIRNRERLRELEVEMVQLKTRAEELQERIKRDHEVDIKELGRFEDPEFNADITQKRTIEIQDRMRRMGAVNLAALEDYDVHRERFEFLARQRDDLLEAEETLKRTIQRIDREARGRFLETFSSIRENFKRTFVAFFEGGEVDLFMPADEDPLEAPMHIIARPKGKRLQNINLLSGGERALTAIALLFAIYLVKTSPFCILDEVDAPLDDANVDRFVRVLQEFAEHTQFVLVTHNKGTMEVADSLYGITMEEPGVSKLVSVRLTGGEAEGNGRAEAEAMVEASADDD